ncbi:hypothetical protein CKA32_005283 [Geitlerinema sp. FC II]|nr:hypothetical protein CKA32_005283 [Geitlerinema sp. FC II]
MFLSGSLTDSMMARLQSKILSIIFIPKILFVAREKSIKLSGFCDRHHHHRTSKFQAIANLRNFIPLPHKSGIVTTPIQILRSTPAIAESLAGGVAKRDRGE